MKYLIFIVFLINTQFLNAQTFEPPVIIDPPHPMVGDTIRVGVYKEFYPPCLLLPWQNQQGKTHLFEYYNNLIQLTVVAENSPICNPLPIIVLREYYDLGSLPEGEYSLSTFVVGKLTPLPLPEPNIYPVLTYGEQIIFKVTRPEVINILSKFSILILTMLLFFSTFFVYKKLPT